jgi:hypothetical protein
MMPIHVTRLQNNLSATRNTLVVGDPAIGLLAHHPSNEGMTSKATHNMKKGSMLGLTIIKGKFYTGK